MRRTGRQGWRSRRSGPLRQHCGPPGPRGGGPRLGGSEGRRIVGGRGWPQGAGVGIGGSVGGGVGGGTTTGVGCGVGCGVGGGTTTGVAVGVGRAVGWGAGVGTAAGFGLGVARGGAGVDRGAGVGPVVARCGLGRGLGLGVDGRPDGLLGAVVRGSMRSPGSVVDRADGGAHWRRYAGPGDAGPAARPASPLPVTSSRPAPGALDGLGDGGAMAATPAPSTHGGPGTVTDASPTTPTASTLTRTRTAEVDRAQSRRGAVGAHTRPGRLARFALGDRDAVSVGAGPALAWTDRSVGVGSSSGASNITARRWTAAASIAPISRASASRRRRRTLGETLARALPTSHPRAMRTPTRAVMVPVLARTGPDRVGWTRRSPVRNRDLSLVSISCAVRGPAAVSVGGPRRRVARRPGPCGRPGRSRSPCRADRPARSGPLVVDAGRSRPDAWTTAGRPVACTTTPCRTRGRWHHDRDSTARTPCLSEMRRRHAHVRAQRGGDRPVHRVPRDLPRPGRVGAAHRRGGSPGPRPRRRRRPRRCAPPRRAQPPGRLPDAPGRSPGTQPGRRPALGVPRR